MNQPQPIPLEERRKIVSDLMTTAFEKAGAFLALVGGAGYAGLFAIWGWVSPYLQRWETLTIAALLGASLLLFIVWQLFGQIILAKQQMDFGHALAVENVEFDAAFATYQQKSRKTQIMMRRIWLPALTVIAIPGVAGGVLLAAACVRHLIC
jgi:hypothetical protein